MTISDRVARRYAKEFTTPEAKDEYLHAHPGADPTKHTVSQPEEKAPKDEGSHGGGHGKEDSHGDDSHGGGHGHGPKKSLKDKLKELGAALKNAPEATKKFLTDPEHRKESMKTAAKKAKASPKAYLNNLRGVWKHEKQEFKDAGAGIAAVMKGGKASDHQKHAIKEVSKHIALTAAYALTTSSGVGVAGAFAMSMGKYMAFKAVGETLADLYILQKQGIIGQGVLHLLDKLASEDGKKVSPEEALNALVLKKVLEQFEKGMSDEDVAEALESFDEGEDKVAATVARRFLASSPQATDTVGVLRAMQGELHKFKAWSRGFGEVFLNAQANSKDAPEGLVWQDDMVDFWTPFGAIQKRLFDLESELDPGVSADVEQFIDAPRSARIEEAINEPKFLKRDGREAIAYSEKDLKAWYNAFTWWVAYGISGIEDRIQETSV